MTPPSPPPLSPNGSPPIETSEIPPTSKKRCAIEEECETTKRLKSDSAIIGVHLNSTSLQSLLEQPHKKYIFYYNLRLTRIERCKRPERVLAAFVRLKYY
jgi:hypothetical protein